MQTSWYLTNSYQDFEFEENHGFTIILKDTKVFFFFIHPVFTQKIDSEQIIY